MNEEKTGFDYEKWNISVHVVLYETDFCND